MTHVPIPGKKLVDDPVYELVTIERLADVVMYEPAPRERPVEDTKLRGRPVDDVVYDSTPRDRPVDDQKLRGRPGDDQTYEPKPKGRPVDPNTVPLWCEPPPPADLPEWSESEVMLLIIIENSLVVNKPKTTDGLLPIGSDILLPQSPEVTSFDDQGSMSAPLSPNRVRKGHSQDMPAEGSLFEVSPDVPGFHMRPAGGGVQMAEITQPSPSKFAGFNNPFFGAPIAFAQRRLCQYIICRRIVTLVLISRPCRQCLLREFPRTVSLGRPRRISYGISSGKDHLMRVRSPWKQKTAL